MSANHTARGARSGDYPYFRSLWNLVVVLLLAAAFLPLLLLGSVIYVYTTGALKEKAVETLRLQVQDHRTVIDQFLSERASDLSDVYLGYRQVPHFIIAVTQQDAEGFWILRATVDAAFFERFVAASAGDFKAEANLVNREGVYQTRPRSAGTPMEKSPFQQIAPFDGIRIEERGERIFAMAWQKTVPWVSIVEMNRADIFADLNRARWICLFTFILGALLIIPTVLLTTNNLVRRLESKRKDLRFLDQQLQHASRMASSGQLAQGALEDITDSLANIHSASQWLRELWGQRPQAEPDPDEISGTLEQIDSEIHRSEKAVKRGLDLARPSAGPVCIDLIVHELIGELLDLMRRELHFKRIRVKRDSPDPAASVCSDPDGLRQVLQNLISNAVAATADGGDTRSAPARRAAACG
jgi:two-component system NtrC family sensor kinase